MCSGEEWGALLQSPFKEVGDWVVSGVGEVVMVEKTRDMAGRGLGAEYRGVRGDATGWDSRCCFGLTGS